MIKNESIKLPSSYNSVNVGNIWKVLLAIAKTGQTFTKEQIMSVVSPKMKADTATRNFAYIKYLGLISEARVAAGQRFVVVDLPIIKDVFYELKADRQPEAKAKLKEYLITHSLYRTLQEEFFKGELTKTLTDLEHFLRDSNPDKAPKYYQEGGKFIVKLLGSVNILELSNSDIKLLVEQESEVDDLPSQDTIDSDDDDDGVSSVPVILNEKHKPVPSNYHIKIAGPNLNLEMSIQSLSHLALIENTLQMIKMEVQEGNSTSNG